jgi:hypothetical protein
MDQLKHPSVRCHFSQNGDDGIFTVTPIINIYKAAIKQIRWLRKEDWDLVDVEATNERRLFPPQWSPYFVEEWKCKRTGKTRIVLVR